MGVKQEYNNTILDSFVKRRRVIVVIFFGKIAKYKACHYLICVRKPLIPILWYLQRLSKFPMKLPSRHMTSKRRRNNVDATCKRRIDVNPTSFQRHVPSEILPSVYTSNKSTYSKLIFLTCICHHCSYLSSLFKTCSS